jgi:hypothetical protein
MFFVIHIASFLVVVSIGVNQDGSFCVLCAPPCQLRTSQCASQPPWADSICKDSDYFAQYEENGENFWKLQKKFLSLQHERNLFRVRAPFGSASDLLK